MSRSAICRPGWPQTHRDLPKCWHYRYVLPRPENLGICVCLWICACEPMCAQSQKRVLNPLELELQAVVNCLIW
ncbi:hypothetical protein LEMLEM_LOCUS13932, partial [Lemmus lemmus]